MGSFVFGPHNRRTEAWACACAPVTATHVARTLVVGDIEASSAARVLVHPDCQSFKAYVRAVRCIGSRHNCVQVVFQPVCGFSVIALLPRRWVVERSFAWIARFRRLARDYERLAETPAGLHFVAFAVLMAHRFVTLKVQSA